VGRPHDASRNLGDPSLLCLEAEARHRFVVLACADVISVWTLSVFAVYCHGAGFSRKQANDSDELFACFHNHIAGIKGFAIGGACDAWGLLDQRTSPAQQWWHRAVAAEQLDHRQQEDKSPAETRNHARLQHQDAVAEDAEHCRPRGRRQERPGAGSGNVQRHPWPRLVREQHPDDPPDSLMRAAFAALRRNLMARGPDGNLYLTGRRRCGRFLYESRRVTARRAAELIKSLSQLSEPNDSYPA